MLCFIKLTGEHNAKKYFKKIFVLWEYIFKFNFFNRLFYIRDGILSLFTLHHYVHKYLLFIRKVSILTIFHFIVVNSDTETV